VLIYCTAAISGGHLNPAVSFALAITKQIPPMKMVCYWGAQILGCTLGALFYQSIQNSNDTTNNSAGCTLPCGSAGADCKLSGLNVFGFEFCATFLLVFTVFGSAVDPKTGAGNFAPIAIGFSLFVAALSIGPFTGAGLNPARTLGPAFAAGSECFDSDGFGNTLAYVYVLAQLIGGGFAGFVYHIFFLNRPDDGQAKASSAFQFMAVETKAVKARLDQKNSA